MVIIYNMLFLNYIEFPARGIGRDYEEARKEWKRDLT